MQTAKRAGWLILLLLTWLILFYTLTFFTQLIMTPWDTALRMPEIGTWQRTLNDFFGYRGGRFLFSVPLIVLSAGLTLNALRTRPDALAKFVAGNLLFFGALPILFVASSFINNGILYPYPPVSYDPNYRGFHLSIFPMSVILAACVGWIVWQWRIASTDTRKLAVSHQM